jgi:hypothetical protein
MDGLLSCTILCWLGNSTVHTTATQVQRWVRDYAKTLHLNADELRGLRRPGCSDPPFINDLAFTALVRVFRGRRFVVSGDWNTCRDYSGGHEFFARAQSHQWVECHQGPEEQSYFGRKTSKPYQLDHAFCDSTTGGHLKSCVVHVDAQVRSLSDHAPLVIDFNAN